MDLREVAANWNEFGKTDPLWAILTLPDKKGNRWDVEEFFQTGVAVIDQVMAFVQSLGLQISGGKALDFGCGVGRLTQALARHFDIVYGVDIAPSMIELARQMNRCGERCQYVLNQVDNLSLFGDASFDFIAAAIVLQHMEPRYAKSYIREFVRLLAPTGVLVFQLPSGKVTRPSAELRRMLRALVPEALLERARGARGTMRRLRRPSSGHEPPPMTPNTGPSFEMHAIGRDEVERLLTDVGARVVGTVENDSAGPGWVSVIYYVVRG